jgi:hypothetical protein
MPAKAAPAGLNTPLLSPRPPELQLPDGENKRKSSVDQAKLSPRVAASKEGRGIETPRGLFGKIASAAKALTPSGKLAKQEARRAEQHEHAVTVLKPLIGLLIRSATEPQFSERAGKTAADALQTTPEKPHLQNTAIAKKQRSAAEARKAAGKEQSAAGNVLRLVTTGLVGVIPMDLEQLDTTGIGANPYFDTTARSHLQRLYRGPQLYTGPRKAYHLDFFLRVARSAVAELEEEGRSVAPAVEVIEYILDQTLPPKLHGGEIWAFLTIILKAVRHEADSVDEAGAADQIEPKRLFIADPDDGPRTGEVALEMFERREKHRADIQGRIADFRGQAEQVVVPAQRAITTMLPDERAAAVREFVARLQGLASAHEDIFEAMGDNDEMQDERAELAGHCQELGQSLMRHRLFLLNLPEEFAAEVHEAMFALGITVAEKPTAMESLIVHGQQLLDSVYIKTFTNTRGLGHLFFSAWLKDADSLIRSNYPELEGLRTDEIAIDALAELHHRNPKAVESLLKTISDDDFDDILDSRPIESIDGNVRRNLLDAVVVAQRERPRLGLSEQVAVAPRSANAIVNEFNAVARNFQEAVEAGRNDLAREIATTANQRQAALASEIESLSDDDRMQFDFARMALGIMDAPDPNLMPRGLTPDGARFRRTGLPQAGPVFRKPAETPDAVDPSIYAKEDGLVARMPPPALKE